MVYLDNLKGFILIAVNALKEDEFYKSVVYIVEHNVNGAMGVVVNKAMDLSIDELFEELSIPYEKTQDFDDHQVVYGGPVKPNAGLVLHESLAIKHEWQSSLIVDKGILLTSSSDILNAIGEQTGPKKSMVILGYSGWSEGQLEAEIARGDWLVLKAETALLFDTDMDERWQKSIELLGFNPAQLSHLSGRA